MHSKPDNVLLVQMPFATPEFPGLGPTLLRSILIQNGMSCDIKYANLSFSRLIGGDPFIEKQLTKLPVCEIAFAPYYFDSDPREVVEYLEQFLEGVMGHTSPDRPSQLHGLVRSAGRLMDELMAETDWSRYAVVGFATMMQQTVASLGLARRIKEQCPWIRIVFGGANTSKPMGEEMIRRFPEIDVIVEGEADGVITPLMQHLVAAGALEDLNVPSILYRRPNGDVVRSASGAAFDQLESLPIPDYAPFFQQLEANGLTHVQPYLTIETSRGCWWGAKHHCTFCGMDDEIMKFRSKSDAKVIDEILTLSAKHKLTDFFVVDSIINRRFLSTLLPSIGGLRDSPGFDFSFFFESKSNIGRKQIRIMRYGGVNSVQPGIEAFDDHILGLMAKGSTGARQIQCLKLIAEAGLIANWNLLFKLPFETAEDYRRTIAVIPHLHHLPPLHDEGLTPMLLNRFAPYHNTPEKFGITNIRPLSWYPKVFPQADIDLNELGFYFEYDCPTFKDEELLALHRQLDDAIRLWQSSWTDGSLVQRRGPGFVVIDDQRVLPDGKGGLLPPRRTRTTLQGVHAEIFTACDEVRTDVALKRDFMGRLRPDETEAFLQALSDECLIYRSHAGQIINLPLLLESREVGAFLVKDLAAPQSTASAQRKPEVVALRVAR